jgi:2-methylaconitate cis-trans-isomerase PrpF
MSERIRSVIMRGGTSRAVFLKEADLPRNEALRDAAILSIFGSPDRRQIDGLGGADPLTSKLAVIGPPRTSEARAAGTHLTYTFGQVEIDTPEIDYLSLCGNISSAVGVFAVEENLVEPTSPVTTVRVFNTNLKRVLSVEVPVDAEGHVVTAGVFSIAGVPGTGARILVDFADTAGAAAGALLPTGNAVDRLTVPGVGEIEASLVDIGNAHVFIRARDVGLKGTETAAEIDADQGLRKKLEAIRGVAAQRMGLVQDWSRSQAETPATPILGMIAAPADYHNALDGSTVAADRMDVLSRLMFMQQMHKTYAGTSTVCTGVASRLPGTLVHEVSRPESSNSPVCRIGHPGGVVETEVATALSGNQYVVSRATLGRTARRIMEGYAFLPPNWRERGAHKATL